MEDNNQLVVDAMWKDLHNKGYFQKDKETFDKFFFAPGEEGYNNRYKLWKDLHNKGYLESPTYEDFAARIGLQPVQKETTAPNGENGGMQLKDVQGTVMGGVAGGVEPGSYAQNFAYRLQEGADQNTSLEGLRSDLETRRQKKAAEVQAQQDAAVGNVKQNEPEKSTIFGGGSSGGGGASTSSSRKSNIGYNKYTGILKTDPTTGEKYYTYPGYSQAQDTTNISELQGNNMVDEEGRVIGASGGTWSPKYIDDRNRLFLPGSSIWLDGTLKYRTPLDNHIAQAIDLGKKASDHSNMSVDQLKAKRNEILGKYSNGFTSSPESLQDAIDLNDIDYELTARSLNYNSKKDMLANRGHADFELNKARVNQDDLRFYEKQGTNLDQNPLYVFGWQKLVDKIQNDQKMGMNANMTADGYIDYLMQDPNIESKFYAYTLYRASKNNRSWKENIDEVLDDFRQSLEKGENKHALASDEKDVMAQYYGGELDRMDAEYEKELEAWNQRYNKWSSNRSGLGWSHNPIGSYAAETGDNALGMIHTAQNLSKDARSMIDEAMKTGKGFSLSGEVGAAVRGLGNSALDWRTYTFGLVDLEDNKNMYNVAKKWGDGGKLNKAEQLLLDQMVLKAASDAFFKDYLSTAYEAGQTTGYALEFILEMMTGAGAATDAAVRAMATGLKKLGKRKAVQFLERIGVKSLVEGTLKKMGGITTKLANSKSGKLLAKAVEKGTKVVDEAVSVINRGVGQTIGPGVGHVVAGAYEGATGQAKGQYNPKTGRMEVTGFDNIEDFFTSTIKSAKRQFGENASEFLGDSLFDPGIKFINNFYRKASNKAFKKFGMEDARAFLDSLKGSDWYRFTQDFRKQIHYNGSFGEYCEEVANNIYNAAFVGDQNFNSPDDPNSVFNFKQNWRTYASCKFMSLAFGTANVIGYRTPKYRAKKDIDRADEIAKRAFRGLDWGSIAASIRNGSDEQVQQLMVDIARSKKYNARQREAAIKYAGAVYALKGIEAGEPKKTPDTPAEGQLKEMYGRGYNMENYQAISDANGAYERAKQGVAWIPPEMLQMIDEEPAYVYEWAANNPNWSEQEKQQLFDYLNAKATYEGAQARLKDDEASIRADVESGIDQRTNKKNEDGTGGDNMIHPVVLKNGKRVYVTGGNVEQDSQGKVVSDTNDLIVVDEDNNTSMIAAKDIETVEEVESPDEQKQMANDAITQGLAETTGVTTTEEDVEQGDEGADGAGAPNMERGIEAFAQGYFGEGKVPEGWVQTMVDNPAEFNRLFEEVSKVASVSPNSDAARAITAFNQEIANANNENEKGYDGVLDAMGIEDDQARQALNETWGQTPPADAMDVLNDLMGETNPEQRESNKVYWAQQPEVFNSQWRYMMGDVTPDQVNAALAAQNETAAAAASAPVAPETQAQPQAQQPAQATPQVQPSQVGTPTPQAATTPGHYEQDDDVVLNVGGEQITGFISNVLPDGKLRLQLDAPINGNVVVDVTPEELDKMVAQPQVGGEVSGENGALAPQGGTTAAAPTTPTAPAPQTAQAAPEVPQQSPTPSTGIVSDNNTPIPMVDGKTDYSAATPERAHHNIYNERGLSKERADKVVTAAIAKREAEAAAANEAVAKARRALEKHQAKDIDIDNIDADMAEEQRLADALRDAEAQAAQAQNAVDYWKRVKDVEDAANRSAKESAASGETAAPAAPQETAGETQAPAPQEESSMLSANESGEPSNTRTNEGESGEETTTAAEEELTPDERIERARMEALENRAEELAESCGLPVQVARSLDELSDSHRRQVEKQHAERKYVNGFYDPKTKQIVLFLPDIAKNGGMRRLERTFLHEGVSHGGLRALFENAPQNGIQTFDELCDQVWEMMPVMAQAQMMNYIGVEKPEDMTQEKKRIAADEYMAHLAELGVEQSVKSRIINAIKNALRKIGIKMRLNNNDIVNLLAASRRNLTEMDKVRESLNEQGVATSESGDALFSVRYLPTEQQREQLEQGLMEQTGRSKEDVDRWLESKTSLASFILNDPDVLDYVPDPRDPAIKNNSDYPQGTVDFSNICRKRKDFTNIYSILQKENPDRVFTASDLEDIRQTMIENGYTVACGLCFVEDRRQLLGEIAQDFINRLNNGDLKPASEKKLNGDTYVPTISELITPEGSKKLYREHPNVWEAFVAHNNARGQQAGRLFQGYNEYKREILKWNDTKVKKVNDAGGLRIFSFSDFEAPQLLDIVQVIEDCAARGVKIQGYTKVPEFARAIRNTGVKLNRSLIPKGDGVKVVDGKEVLDYDPVEGIDINDNNFLDEEDNPNVGNILVGINDKQIKLAMVDPFVDYIIPFHSGLSKSIRQKKGIGDWVNYKNFQREYEKDSNKAAQEVNIYTDVLQAAEAEGKPITNKREFVEKFLEVCKERGIKPRFWNFLDTDADGNYIYTDGYHKFLVDFKLFDKEGNLVPQEVVQPIFDDEFNKKILDNYAEGEKTGTDYGPIVDAVKERLGLRFSFTNSREEFDALRDRALLEKGIVRPGLEDIDVEVVPVGEHGFTGTKPISQAREWAKKNLATPKDKAGNYVDKPKLIDGTPYIITNNAIKKFLSDSAVKKTGDVKLHLSVLKQLKEIIGKSIEGEVHASHIKDEYDERKPENGLIENQLVHRMFGAVSFDGGVYIVKTTVIEERDGNNRAYTYEVTDAEIELAATDATTKAEPMGPPHIGAANLLRDIKKSKDSDVYLINNSQKTTNNSDGLMFSTASRRNTTSIDAAIVKAGKETNTEPTDAQKEAGNYKKGHVKIDGFDVSIEQPKGSVRSGVDGDGKAWSQKMNNTYGYIRGTEGVDGDHIDVFLSDNLDGWNGTVYVVDQVNKDGSFDEHKVMYGFNSEEEARKAYLSNYEDGWDGDGGITGVSKDEFKKWIDSSHRKTKPFAEYKNVKVEDLNATRFSTSPVEDRRESEESKRLFDATKEKFGTTNDIREAGYILPDGTMLDFSGRHMIDEGYDASHLAGRRAVDHRAIYEVGYDKEENDTGFETNMQDFIGRGAIRIDANAGSINLSMTPTPAQARVLRNLIMRNDGDVTVDFGDGYNSEHYAEYENARPTRVLGDIDRYFSEGIKPEGNIRFSTSPVEEKTLMGVHNITAEKLKSAIGLGGLANPSMAVVDTTKGLLNNFGEISLIPGSALIDSKTGRNAGTWAADAYTPRFPKTHRRLGKGGDKKLKQWLDGLGMRQEMNYNTQDQFNDYYNGFDIQDNALVYPFLYERGMADAVDTYDHNKVSAPYRELISEYDGDLDALMDAFDNNEEVMQQVTDIVIDDMVRDSVKKQEGESFSDWKKRRRALRQEISENLLNMAGYLDRDIARDILKKECEKYVEGSRFNPEATRQAASIYIDKNGLREEYNKYRDEKLGELGVETQMYAGSDSQGRSKFKPVTLESVSKEMKKQGRAGAESGFGSGPGGVRARVTPRLKTLKQIKAERGRIQNDIDGILQDYTDEFFETARNIFNGSTDILGDVLASNDMRAAAKEHGYELEDSTIGQLRDFRDRMVSLPTEYFETKFERPVALNEFEAAIVPNDVDPEIREALEGAGLDVREYNPGEAGDREKVTLEAANDAGNVLFSTTLVDENSEDYREKVESDNAAEPTYEANNLRFSVLDPERDADLIAELDGQDYVTVYRTMAKVNGEYYPPMDSRDHDNPEKLRNPEKLGQYTQSEERPDLAYAEEYTDKKTGEKKTRWKFNLRKSNGKSVDGVAYNPYMHTSDSALNDQFSEAQDRDDLVVVECRVPVSELDPNSYHAEKALDPVGWKPWKAGPIVSKMTGKRNLLLSRWVKPVKELSWSEVADMVSKQLGDQFDVLPSNTFSKGLRAELEKRGYKFIETDNKGIIKDGLYKGVTWSDRYYDIHPEKDTRSNKKQKRAKVAKAKARNAEAGEGVMFPTTAAVDALKDDERVYNDLLGKVFSGVSNETRRGIVGDAMENRGYDFGAATEAWLMGLADDDMFAQVPQEDWRAVKNALGNALRENGVEGSMTDNEARYVLWKAGQIEDGVFSMAEDIVKREELLNGASAPQYTDSADVRFSTSPAEQIYSDNFKDWFGDWENDPENASKVVDEDGRPKVVLHGTPNKDFYAFELGKAGSVTDAGWLGEGFYFYGNNRDYASQYAGKDGRILEVYLDIKNPYIASYEEMSRLAEANDPEVSRQFREKLEAEGYDGVFYNDDLNEEWVAFYPEQIKSATENNGDFSRENPDIRFSVTPRDRAIARDQYDRMMRSGRYQFVEAVQDSMLGLKKLMEAIMGDSYDYIEDIPMYENPYITENLMSSSNAAQQHEYSNRLMAPIIKEINKLTKGKNKARNELIDYMMAKHGLERNQVLADRDAKETAEAGGDYQEAYAENRERDYAGLTALTGEDDVHAAEAKAQQMVDDYEQQHDTTELWGKVNAATKTTLAKLYQCGIMSKETYQKTRDMFEYYIPLRGYDEKTSDKVYGYLTSKDGPLTGGSIMKRAGGRTTKADDPFSNIAMMADKAITEGNRNLMKQTFLNFVRNHPSDAVSVSELWLQYDATKDEWVPVFPKIPADASPAEVEQITEQFEADMQQLAQQEPDKYKHGRETANIPYKVIPGNEREHQVLVKMRGQTYVLTINGNPRAAQAINGLTNPDTEATKVIGKILEKAQAINRGMSAVYTTMNPDFVVSNFLRDMYYANTMVYVKEKGNYGVKFNANVAKLNPLTIYYLLQKWENGTLNENRRIEKLFKQFMLNGGETGYTTVWDVERYKKSIDKELRKQNNIALKAMGKLGGQLEMFNRSVENVARFAAFVTSVEMGRSYGRAAYDAKEISVNFNKKGSGGTMFGATGQTFLGNVGAAVSSVGRQFFVFWNAGVQGMTNFGRNTKRHPVKGGLGAASLFGLGILIPLLAGAGGGDGDDEDKNAYYNLPEYIRRSNLCIYADGKWVTIPLPVEYRAIYGLGELAYGVVAGKERYSDEELAMQISSQFSQLLPIDMLEGGGGWHPFIPTLLKPIVETGTNTSWSGLPIHPDSPFDDGKYMPEYTKVYQSTDKDLIKLSEFLNRVTGGNGRKKGMVDINPANIEYWLNGYLGGLFTFPIKVKKSAETAFGDREFEWKNIPFANRVIKEGDERTEAKKLKNEFFKYKEEYEETKWRLQGYGKDTDQGIFNYAKELADMNYSKEYGRYVIFDKYAKDFEDLEKIKKRIADGTLPAEMKQEYDAEDLRLKRQLVEEMHAYEDGKYTPDKPKAEDQYKPKDEETKVTIQKHASSFDEVRMVDEFSNTGNQYKPANNDVMAEAQKVGMKMRYYKQKNKVKHELGLSGSTWNLDGDKSAEKKRFYNSHKALLDRVGRYRWREREIGRLMDEAKENKSKEASNYKRIYQIIQDDIKDEEQFQKSQKK